jgi:hypothetical protein
MERFIQILIGSNDCTSITCGPPPWASLGYGTGSGALDNEHKPSKLRRTKIPSSNLRRGPVHFVVIIVHSFFQKMRGCFDDERDFLGEFNRIATGHRLLEHYHGV